MLAMCCSGYVLRPLLSEYVRKSKILYLLSLEKWNSASWPFCSAGITVGVVSIGLDSFRIASPGPDVWSGNQPA